MAIRSWATQSALGDPSEVVVRSAAIQTSGIPIVATRYAVIQNAEIQNVVILFEAQVVTPNVALSEATQNAVLSVVQDVARGAVIQCAVTLTVVLSVVQDVARSVGFLCVVLNEVQDVAQGVATLYAVIQCVVTPFAVTRIAADRCEGNLDAMVDSQDAFLFSVQALV